MKKLFLFVFAAIAFVACTQNDVEELSSNRVYLPDEISVGFENNDETRIQLCEGKSVWNAGDLVSVFYKTLDNLMWEFQGEDGDRTGLLKMIEGSVGKQKMSEVVVVYPYNQDYILAINNRSVEAKMPAKQEYRYESYDPVCNLMIATSEGRDFVLKNTCGWLKIELTGDGQQVEKLTLRGNNGETVAGDVTIDWDSSKATFISNGTTDPDDTEVGGSIVFDDASYDKLELNCHRAVLSSEPTAFYFTLPEQHFADGITVEVKCRGYKSMVLSTDDAVEIKRNHIKPMAAVEFEAEEGEGSEIPNNEIWYTATEQIWPNYEWDSGITLINNYYDDSTGEGILEFDGELTKIGYQAFAYCGSLTSITIPDSITTIGDSAFNWCYSLTSITIPDSVTTIGLNAFAYCTNLVEFNGKFASEDGRCLIVDGTLNSFAPAGLTSYTIPDSVTTIGKGAFLGCDSLTSVTIPDSVTTIGDKAFAGCESLTSVTIPDSVTTIGKGAFLGCESLTSVTIPDSVTTIGDEAFAGCESLTSVTIPDSVTTIGEAAFHDCISLTSVTIPDSVTTIGEHAFSACYNLTSVTIPDSVTTIGNFAFAECRSLTSITIPDSVTTIGKGAFAGCRSLTSITIPDSVTTIGDSTFTSCGSLTSITIPDSVTTIGNDAFSECDSLTSITIPNSVTTIGVWAFGYCSRLTSVTIPDSVTTIGEAAFASCTSLTSVYCEATTPPSLGDYVFDDNASGRKIYVPVESLDAYLNAEGWSDYADAIVGYDFDNPENNPKFTTSNLVVSYSDFTLDVKPLKGEKSFWTYYIWTKKNYEEVLNNEAQANIVMRSYWGLNNTGIADYGLDFGTFIKEYMGQIGTSQISAYEPLENDTEYVVVLFYMDPEASDPTIVYDYNYVAVEFKTLAPSAEDYATLEVTGPYIEAADNKYNIHFNVKTNDTAADIKVGTQLWSSYDFAKYWDENDWSQIQAFFFFRTSVSAESLASAKTEEGATVSFTGFDKNDYVFFFEALTEDNTPTQYAIRVTTDMFE